MRRFPFTPRRAVLTIAATFVASLVVSVSGAGAIVVSDAGTVAGVSLVPGARNNPLPSGVSAVTSAASCTDPWLASDFGGPALAPNFGLNPLCYRGAAVMHKNEVFALTWDQHRAYWSETRGYVEQFLRDVADDHSLGNPYAVTTQYNDAGGRAQNSSSFGGGCIDYGSVGGSACEFGTQSSTGHNFPSSGCTVAGDSFVNMGAVTLNTDCLTDAQLQSEVATMVTQTGMLGRTTPGYTPLVTLLLPAGVEACLDAASNLCSINRDMTPPSPAATGNSTGGTILAGAYNVVVTYQTTSGETGPSEALPITLTGATNEITVDSPPAAPGVTGWNVYVTGPDGVTYTKQAGPTAIGSPVILTSLTTTGATPPNPEDFCSYHSQVNVGGTEVAYVVQPWSAMTWCDDPSDPTIAEGATPHELSIGAGQRIVSPLSQSHIAAIVNPAFSGWAAADGSEIDDNHVCTPLPKDLDKVTIGSSSQNPYWIQREFNNAATLEFEPNTYFGCVPNVILNPLFVVPSAVNQGDEVQFDGSATASTLMVPNLGYSWNFGDGTPAVTGPSLVHTFAKAGTYTVTLTVTDRGVNTASYSQVITVLTSTGQPAPPPTAPGGTQGGGGGGGGGGTPGGQITPLSVHLQLLPASLRSVLTWGVRLRVTSNEPANGLVTVSISRAAARRAHIAVGKAPSVVIGRGTVSQVRNGTITLRLGLSRVMTRKLHSLRHVALTVRMALVPKVGHSVAIVIAGIF